MTNSEEKINELDKVPQVLLDILSQQAYERGHHAGQEEVNAVLMGLVYDFNPISKILKENGYE